VHGARFDAQHQKKKKKGRGLGKEEGMLLIYFLFLNF
jgi:hypothetical protein